MEEAASIVHTPRQLAPGNLFNYYYVTVGKSSCMQLESQIPYI